MFSVEHPFYFMFKFFKKNIPKYDWLICGLGNPGEKYAFSRHNIGWMVVDNFAKKHNKVLSQTSLIYQSAEIAYNGKKILIAKPTTYMNKSGEAISKLVTKHQIQPERLIVILDEYNFPLGKIQIKDSGGDGGHNGMFSVLDYLNDFRFFRLRCGIDKNFGPGKLVEYVLSDFKPNEIIIRDQMIVKACLAIKHMIQTDNPSRAMSEINSGSYLPI